MEIHLRTSSSYALRTLKTVAICSSTSYRQLSFPQRVNSVYIQQINDLPTPSLSIMGSGFLIPPFRALI